jgi:enoyl-CoA hydratase/carnithine racemase
VSAQRAKEIGLVMSVVPHEELLDAAHALADRLLRGAPLAQRAIKEVARRAPHLPEADAIRFGETMRRVAGATADAAEGAAAARDKRPPRWQGR